MNNDHAELTKVQRRFQAHGMRLFSAMHPAYRSLRIQLGQKGRDDDIEQYRTFLRSCGRLGVPCACKSCTACAHKRRRRRRRLPHRARGSVQSLRILPVLRTLT